MFRTTSRAPRARVAGAAPCRAQRTFRCVGLKPSSAKGIERSLSCTEKWMNSLSKKALSETASTP
jgi:hypothetical protein